MVLLFTLAQPSGTQWPFSTNHPFFGTPCTSLGRPRVQLKNPAASRKILHHSVNIPAWPGGRLHPPGPHRAVRARGGVWVRLRHADRDPGPHWPLKFATSGREVAQIGPRPGHAHVRVHDWPGQPAVREQGRRQSHASLRIAAAARACAGNLFWEVESSQKRVNMKNKESLKS